MKLKHGPKLIHCVDAVNHHKKENAADAGKNCRVCTPLNEISIGSW